MPTNITDVDTFTSTIVTAADGDAVNGASRETEAQGLADRSRYLYNRNIEAKGGLISVPLVSFRDEGAKWTWYDPDLAIREVNTAAPQAYFGIPNRLNAKITEFHVMVNGDFNGVGPHVGLPAVMPFIRAWEVDNFGAGLTVLGTTTDPSASVGAYESNHTISITGIAANNVFDEQKQFVLMVEGEGSTNSLANALYILGVYVKIEAA